MDYKIKGIRKGAKEWQTLRGLHFFYEMIWFYRGYNSSRHQIKKSVCFAIHLFSINFAFVVINHSKYGTKSHHL